jgi:hypothetical protein
MVTQDRLNRRIREEVRRCATIALRRRIAALVVMAFLSVMGATVAAATLADSTDAQTAFITF